MLDLFQPWYDKIFTSPRDLSVSARWFFWQAAHPRYALVDDQIETMWQRPEGTVKGASADPVVHLPRYCITDMFAWCWSTRMWFFWGSQFTIPCILTSSVQFLHPGCVQWRRDIVTRSLLHRPWMQPPRAWRLYGGHWDWRSLPRVRAMTQSEVPAVPGAVVGDKNNRFKPLQTVITVL